MFGAAFRIGFVVLVVLAALRPAYAQMKFHEGVRTTGILKADIYTPERATAGGFLKLPSRLPVIVYVHGGGWIKGDRAKVHKIPEWATAKGYLLVSIDYRPVPRTNIDGQARDVVKGINWVRNNITRYGGDPKRIVIMGHSAGSHLVSYVAARKLAGKITGVIANDVQAYDMVAYGSMRGSLPRVYAAAFGADPTNWVRWSPVTYVRKSSGFPPFLILHSGSNGDRRRALSRGFGSELRRRGARVTVFDGRRYNHGSINRKLGNPGEAVTIAVERFLRQVNF